MSEKTEEQELEEKRKEKEEKMIWAIVDNYKHLEVSLAQQLTLSTPSHNPTTGTYREEIWMSLFEQIVPRKFCLAQSVFIIDSYGHISNEVDIAIFDESYTPYIFRYGKIKFIPIEAVAVAVQCKSTNLGGIDDWAKSITDLKTSLSSIVRVMSGVVDNSLDTSYERVKEGDVRSKKSQTSTRPVLILCALHESGIPKTLQDNKDGPFDIILNVDKEGKLSKAIPHKDDSYQYWYKQLNHYGWERYKDENGNKQEYKYEYIANKECSSEKLASLEVVDPVTKKENIVLSLTFQLNQLLMLINNPIFFPHQAYVNMFREKLQERPQKERFKKNDSGHL